ncbi:sulfite exporter TauE/SafE family protein [Spirosoma endophyticum]|uniref:Probable membrane transporter protein n=1 Tax=Spirosoma endophyticum TaxID=662367 RepID=A0A1I2FD65_9BACT|nr:sulfite exporter TauE/SafE family protein [Spirosoma endophyticum]SFF02839.1 hypothetical protein SAMN05216167_12539 [Spirosoma endophyticum]
MTLSHTIGFLASILIGVSLGLIGGGGSILTLPVLVYLLGINPVLSTAYSLFVVGTTSLVGSVNYMRQRLVNYKAAFVFALPSFLAVFLTRKYLLPWIPEPVLATDTFVLSKDMAIMVLFALIMLAASLTMIRDKNEQHSQPTRSLPVNFTGIALNGILVGLLTGIIGAGGGFLIIPALVLLVRLPMKIAVGTSLLIIAANTLLGFWGGSATLPIDWSFLLRFTALSVGGIFLGTYLARFVAGQKLKKAFGWFVMLMGLYILGHELFL